MQSGFSGCSELYHFSFPEVLQANDPLFLCRSTFLTIQFSTGRFWANFSANHPDSGWLAHIRQHNLCCTLLKEMACKRSSWVSHKMGENVAFCVFEDSKSNFVTRRLHSHSIWVFSLDSVERNGEQKVFLGKLQRGENSCFVWIYEDSTSNFINRQLHSQGDNRASSIKCGQNNFRSLGSPYSECFS